MRKQLPKMFKNQTSTNTSRYLSFFTDFIFLAIIILFGWFLIGYYLQYNYLSTGYQDWIYHAFRVKSIGQWGIVSWDHKWANGINYWKAYQYIPHILVLYTSRLLEITITQAMILWTVVVFVYIRVATYIVLRLISIDKVSAFIVTTLSYSIVQQWLAIKDFSLFIASAFIPLVMFVYYKASRHGTVSSYVLLASLSGFAWSIHPILGLLLCGLTCFSVFAKYKLKGVTPYITLATCVVASAPFLVPYLSNGYAFSNPFYSSLEFINITLTAPYFGFGLGLLILLVTCGVLQIFVLNDESKWAFQLYAFIVFFLLLIYIAKSGNLPDLVNMIQLPRSLYFLSIISLYPIAGVLTKLIVRVKSKFVLSMIVAVISIQFAVSIVRSSEESAGVTNKIYTPIRYFDEIVDQRGSVYYENDSEASYFSDSSLRLVGSYNEHLLPSPLSTRFKNIMSGGKANLLISTKQLSLIEVYSHVLGVEYLLLPHNSPISKSIIASSETSFRYLEDVESEKTQFSVFKSSRNTESAYIMEKEVAELEIKIEDLPKPTLSSSSYKPWDEEITKLSRFLNSKEVEKLDVGFINTNTLSIPLYNVSEYQDPVVLVMQSYDNNWKVNEAPSIDIEPTSLRFMYIDVSGFEDLNTLTLVNEWPDWHWPVQFLGIGSVAVSALYVGFESIYWKIKS